MFSKAIIEKTKSEEGYLVYSNNYNLPNEQVLFIASDEKRKVTTLKIFSENDVTTSLAECTLFAAGGGNCRLLCLLPNGTILLERDEYDTLTTSLLKLCPKTLKILSTQKWSNCYNAGALDNEQFFVINKKDNYYSSESLLTIYKWDNDTYKVASVKPLAYIPEAKANMHTANIVSIGGNRFCCHFRGHNNDLFDVLLFSIDPNTHEIEEFGLIQPITSARSDSSASGTIEVLPNGQLLTYHYTGKDAQIWDTKTRVCIKQWDWNTIKKPDNFTHWCMTIKPFPDSKHLLVAKYLSLYIFNADTLHVKEIVLNGEFNFNLFSKETFRPSFGEHSFISSSGKVLAFVESNVPNCNQVQFDLDQMIHYRKNLALYKDSQIVTRLFFYTKDFPKEVVDYIFSYAFTFETRNAFARREPDETDQSSSCLVM